ncbi:MAG: RNA polymerase sigma factor [Candidatus Paceibacterota bacterium]
MDRNEFSKFYDQNIDKVFRFIYLRVDSSETAQDLTSLVFLKFWQNISLRNDLQKKSKKTISNPRAFLFQIARNQIIDFYRQKNKNPLSLDGLGELADFKSLKPVFEEMIELNMEMERIKKALKAINPLYADVIIWRYVEDLSNQEIAQILKKREGNVRVLLHRALEALKEQLNNQ